MLVQGNMRGEKKKKEILPQAMKSENQTPLHWATHFVANTFPEPSPKSAPFEQ
jgi:hypothetical protein